LAAEAELAPAKVNLALHVTGRRGDGYHLLDSLVVFPRIGDRLEAEPAEGLSLTIEGPFARDLGAGADNLVIRAATLLSGSASGSGAAIRLTKSLPIASGIGGGSADAAATLRLLSRLWRVPLPAADRVLALGADVPVCLGNRAARFGGIGERLVPVALPPFWLVLANPGVPVPTGAVFRGLAGRDNAAMDEIAGFGSVPALVGFLARQRNDLEAPALRIAPEIGAVLAALRAQPGCAVARMSGSGATCFGLFASEAGAHGAADALRAARAGWWVVAAPVG
jgi:4-diphosphocytidyl-2-C-methyl-D-erythritol kinase